MVWPLRKCVDRLNVFSAEMQGFDRADLNSSSKMIYTLPEVYSEFTPEKLPSQQETGLLTIIFRGELLNFRGVSFRQTGAISIFDFLASKVSLS